MISWNDIEREKYNRIYAIVITYFNCCTRELFKTSCNGYLQKDVNVQYQLKKSIFYKNKAKKEIAIWVRMISFWTCSL